MTADVSDATDRVLRITSMSEGDEREVSSTAKGEEKGEEERADGSEQERSQRFVVALDLFPRGGEHSV
jgi:hypothetical protein